MNNSLYIDRELLIALQEASSYGHLQARPQGITIILKNWGKKNSNIPALVFGESGGNLTSGQEILFDEKARITVISAQSVDTRYYAELTEEVLENIGIKIDDLKLHLETLDGTILKGHIDLGPSFMYIKETIKDIASNKKAGQIDPTTQILLEDLENREVRLNSMKISGAGEVIGEFGVGRTGTEQVYKVIKDTAGFKSSLERARNVDVGTGELAGKADIFRQVTNKQIEDMVEILGSDFDDSHKASKILNMFSSKEEAARGLWSVSERAKYDWGDSRNQVKVQNIISHILTGKNLPADQAVTITFQNPVVINNNFAASTLSQAQREMLGISSVGISNNILLPDATKMMLDASKDFELNLASGGITPRSVLRIMENAGVSIRLDIETLTDPTAQTILGHGGVLGVGVSGDALMSTGLGTTSKTWGVEISTQTAQQLNKYFTSMSKQITEYITTGKTTANIEALGTVLGDISRWALYGVTSSGEVAADDSLSVRRVIGEIATEAKLTQKEVIEQYWNVSPAERLEFMKNLKVDSQLKGRWITILNRAAKKNLGSHQGPLYFSAETVANELLPIMKTATTIVANPIDIQWAAGLTSDSRIGQEIISQGYEKLSDVQKAAKVIVQQGGIKGASVESTSLQSLLEALSKTDHKDLIDKVKNSLAFTDLQSEGILLEKHVTQADNELGAVIEEWMRRDRGQAEAFVKENFLDISKSNTYIVSRKAIGVERYNKYGIPIDEYGIENFDRSIGGGPAGAEHYYPAPGGANLVSKIKDTILQDDGSILLTTQGMHNDIVSRTKFKDIGAYHDYMSRMHAISAESDNAVRIATADLPWAHAADRASRYQDELIVNKVTRSGRLIKNRIETFDRYMSDIHPIAKEEETQTFVKRVLAAARGDEGAEVVTAAEKEEFRKQVIKRMNTEGYGGRVDEYHRMLEQATIVAREDEIRAQIATADAGISVEIPKVKAYFPDTSHTSILAEGEALEDIALLAKQTFGNKIGGRLIDNSRALELNRTQRADVGGAIAEVLIRKAKREGVDITKEQMTQLQTGGTNIATNHSLQWRSRGEEMMLSQPTSPLDLYDKIIQQARQEAKDTTIKTKELSKAAQVIRGLENENIDPLVSNLDDPLVARIVSSPAMKTFAKETPLPTLRTILRRLSHMEMAAPEIEEITRGLGTVYMERLGVGRVGAELTELFVEKTVANKGASLLREAGPIIGGVAAAALIGGAIINKAFVDRLPARNKMKDTDGHLTPSGTYMQDTSMDPVNPPQLERTASGEQTGSRFEVHNIPSQAHAMTLIDGLRSRYGNVEVRKGSTRSVSDEDIKRMLDRMI